MEINQKQVKKTQLIFAVVIIMYCIQCYADNSGCGEIFSTRMDQNVFGQHRLRTRVFQSQPISTPLECYVNCMKDCRCVSYNVCKGGKFCELNSQKKADNISLYEASDECDYHEYEFSKLQQSNSCEDPCCSTSHICFNGSRCEALCMKNNERFQCICPGGYAGDRCERKAKSCADYNLNSNRTNGLRILHAPDDTLYPVFCYFNEWSAQTLLQSHTRANHPDLGFPLTQNHPISENEPNWVKYRLSLPRMQVISVGAIQWQITCSFNTRGMTDHDMLRFRTTKLDPLGFASGIACREALIAKIKNAGCQFCKIAIAQQSAGWNMKSDQFSYCSNAVNVVPSVSCSNGKIPGYFGNYDMDCFDEEFSCTSSDDATTQVWFIHPYS